MTPVPQADLDLGNYERFLDLSLSKDNNLTTGKVYQTVIERERRGDYLGKTVQVRCVRVRVGGGGRGAGAGAGGRAAAVQPVQGVARTPPPPCHKKHTHQNQLPDLGK